MNQSEFVLRKTRDFGEIFNGTFTYIKIHFRTILMTYAVYVLPVLLSAAVLIGVIVGLARLDAVTGDMLSSIGGATIIVAILTFLVIVLAFVFFHSASVSLIPMSLERGDDFTYNDVMQVARKNMFPLLGLSLLVSLIGIVPFIVALVLLVMSEAFVLMLILYPFYYVAVFVVTIIQYIASYVYLIEQVSITRAISRTFELLKGHWWRTIGLVFVMYIMYSMVGGMSAILFYIAAALFFVLGISIAESYSVVLIAGGAVSIVLLISVIVVAGILLYVAFGLQYLNIVEQKEAVGLAQRLQALSGAEETQPAPTAFRYDTIDLSSTMQSTDNPPAGSADESNPDVGRDPNASDDDAPDTSSQVA